MRLFVLVIICGVFSNSLAQNFDNHVSNLESAIKNKDEAFGQYHDGQQRALERSLEQVVSQRESVEGLVKHKQAVLASVKLQLGATTADNQETNGKGAANTILECAHAKKLYNKQINSLERTRSVVAATLGFTRALKTRADEGRKVNDKLCLTQVEDTLSNLATAFTALARKGSEAMNATTHTCLSAQNRMLGDKQASLDNDIPLLEDLSALNNEAVVLASDIAALQESVAALKEDERLKQERLSQLRAAVTQHNHLVAQQLDTVSRLRTLLAAF